MMCLCERWTQLAGSCVGMFIPPVTSPPPVRNWITGSFESGVADAGVHIAMVRQSSAEFWAARPASRLSP